MAPPSHGSSLTSSSNNALPLLVKSDVIKKHQNEDEPACPNVVRKFSIEGKWSDDDLQDLVVSEENTLLVNNLLKEHGDPSEIYDQYKTLTQVKLDSERDMCIFAGALEYLGEQLRATRTLSCCPVCERPYDCEQGRVNSFKQLKEKIAETELARTESDVERIHQACSQVLAVFASMDGDSLRRVEACQNRVVYNVRMGSLTELRNQKAECLQGMHCFSCLREFTGGDLCEYLRKVDSVAMHMEQSIHVHHE